MNLLMMIAMCGAMGGKRAVSVDPIREACARACTEAYLPNGGDPVEAKVFCKDPEQFSWACEHVVDILTRMKQFDGDAIEYFRAALNKTPVGRLELDGILLEMKNGSAVRILMEPGVTL